MATTLDYLEIGNITLRKTSTSKKWYVRFRYNGKRHEYSTGTDSKSQAIRKTMAVEKSLDRGINPFEKDGPRIKWFDFVMAEDAIFPQRYIRWKRDTKKGQWPLLSRITLEWGEKYLDEITRDDCEKYLSNLIKEGKSTSTYNRYLSTMSVVFGCAVDWGYLRNKPCDGIKMLKENPKVPEYLTEDQVKTIYRLINPQVKHVIVLMVNTGMRIGEVCDLKWSNIKVSEQKVFVKNRKGGEGEYIPMSSDALSTLKPLKKTSENFIETKDRNFLRHHLRRVEQCAWVSCKINKEKVLSENGEGLEQLKKDFLFKFESKLTSGIIKWVQEKGSGEDVELPHLHPHLFRHTFATWAQDNGGSVGATQQILGHKTPTMTLRYAKATNKQKKGVVDGLPSIID